MKKYLSIILCTFMLSSYLPSVDADAATIDKIMVGTDFENSAGTEGYDFPYLTGTTTKFKGSASNGTLSYTEMEGYDGTVSRVGVMGAKVSGASPSLEFPSAFNSNGNTYLELDFKIEKPISGNFIWLEFISPSGQKNAINMIKSDYDVDNPTAGGTLQFHNSNTGTNPNLIKEVPYELNKWYHIEVRFEDPKAGDVYQDRLFYFVKLNGQEIINKSTANPDAPSKPGNYACYRVGSVLRLASVRINSAKGESKVYLDNFNVRKEFEKPEVSSINFVGGNIEITFNKNMEESSFSGNVKLYEGLDKTEIPLGTGTLANNVYTIAPAISLKSGYEYTVELSNKISCLENCEIDSTADSFSIPMGDVKLTNYSFNVINADYITNSGVSINTTLENSSSNPIDVYGVLALYKDGMLLNSDTKKINVGAAPAQTTFTAAGRGDGAVFYLLDENLRPIRDKIILPNSSTNLAPSGAKSDILSVSYNPDTEIISLTGKTTAYDTVFITTLLSDDTKSIVEEQEVFDFSKVKTSVLSQNAIVAAGQITADKDGYFELCFKKDKDRFDTDLYTGVSVTSSSPVSEDYDYTNPDEIDREMGKINIETDASDMMGLLSSNDDIFGLTDSLNDHDAEKDTVVGQLLINERPVGGYTPATLKTALNKAICISRIKDTAVNHTLVNKYGSEFGFDMTAFASLSSTQYVVDIIGANDYASFLDFENAFSDAIIVCKVSYAETTGELSTLIMTDYASEIEPLKLNDISQKYTDIKEKKNVFSIFMGTKFKTISAIYSAFEDAVKKVYAAENPVYRPSSSGGNKGVFSPGKEVPTIINPVIPPADTTENSSEVFNDLKGSEWAEEGILGLNAMGVVHGDGNGNFRPLDGIRRDEVIKILVCAFEILDKNASVYFADIPKEHWSYPFVSSAYEYGLVEGIGDNLFGSELRMSRQDLMTLIYRLALKKGMVSADNQKPHLYDDYYEIADYAKEAVNYISNIGLEITIENNKFNPNADITRAETAATVWGFLQSIKE